MEETILDSVQTAMNKTALFLMEVILWCARLSMIWTQYNFELISNYNLILVQIHRHYTYSPKYKFKSLIRQHSEDYLKFGFVSSDNFFLYPDICLNISF